MHADDGALLEHGIGLFEAVYRSFAAGAHSTSPRGRRKPARKTRR
jgi:hypothetical protein